MDKPIKTKLKQVTQTRKSRLLKALRDNLGNIHQACIAAKCDRKTHYNYIKNDPIYAQAVSDIFEGAIDIAESKLFENIKSNDNTAIIFFLKTRGATRGYIERKNSDTAKPLENVQPPMIVFEKQ